MFRFALGRAAALPATLFFISALVFLLIHLMPGDPLTFMLGVEATRELIASVSRYYGLDLPLQIQYVHWLKHVLVGDLGRSIHTGEPVTMMIAQRLPTTLTLMVAATLWSWLIAFTAGVWSAVRANTRVDRTITVLASLGLCIPDFVLGILLALCFGLWLKILPMSGFVNPLSDPWVALRHIALPAIALGTIQAALLARLIRSSLLEVLHAAYITTARAKGLREGVVLSHHALRNGLIPAVTTVALNIGQLMGGAIIIEQIFALPGVGRLMLEGILQRDYPVVQALTLMAGLVFVASSFAADVFYCWLNPQIQRYDT
jgi:peptide/nickel transport system permease protein